MTDVGPTVQRDGDTWSFVWHEHDVGLGIDHLRESRGDLHAEVTIESALGGRVLGPVQLNLLSTRSQSELANRCFKRQKSLSQELWDALVVYACAIVAKQFRQPQPVVDLSTVEDPGPVRYLVDQLIPQYETTVLYGDGESAKSLIALAIGMSVATGTDLPWGGAPRHIGNVLYLDWETNRDTVVSRLRGLARGLCIEPPKLFYRQCFRGLVDELPSVREEISRKVIELVIVDSIGFAASGSLVEDETARSAMNGLRQMSPATRLVVAHVSKNSVDATAPAKPFGSAFFWNGMRSGIEVRRSEEQAAERLLDLGVFHRKSNDGQHARPFGLNVIFEGADNGGGITIDRSDIQAVPDLAARTPTSQRIRALLVRGKQTTEALAEELDLKEDTVRRALNRMQGVVRLEDGGGRSTRSVWGLSE